MGIYTDQTIILGIRILIEEPVDSGDYYVTVSYTHLTLPTIYSV